MGMDAEETDDDPPRDEIMLVEEMNVNNLDEDQAMLDQTDTRIIEIQESQQASKACQKGGQSFEMDIQDTYQESRQTLFKSDINNIYFDIRYTNSDINDANFSSKYRDSDTNKTTTLEIKKTNLDTNNINLDANTTNLGTNNTNLDNNNTNLEANTTNSDINIANLDTNDTSLDAKNLKMDANNIPVDTSNTCLDRNNTFYDSNPYSPVPDPQDPAERRMKWGTIIPLIGGSAIGCYKATGTMPFFHLTYSEFAANESHLKRYWPHIPFINLDKKDHLKYDLTGLDFINSVCPCAGLSMLNSSQSSHKGRGADAPQNKWMIESAELVLGKIKPKVYWGENAPGLFTKAGEQMLKKMREIGQTHGYTFSIVKTNTELHGIPQRRIRSFYFYWNTPTVPILNYKERPKPDLITYLKEIPPTANLQDMFMTEGKASVRFRPYQFVLEKEGLTHQEFSAKYGKGTISQYLHQYQLIDDCIDWLKVNYPTESFYCKNVNKPGRTFIMYLEHMKMKISKGLGYWGDSPR